MPFSQPSPPFIEEVDESININKRIALILNLSRKF